MRGGREGEERRGVSYVRTNSMPRAMGSTSLIFLSGTRDRGGVSTETNVLAIARNKGHTDREQQRNVQIRVATQTYPEAARPHQTAPST